LVKLFPKKLGNNTKLWYNNKMNSLDIAKQVFDTEISALIDIKNELNGNFTKIVDDIVNCDGKVILTGMGKPGHIGRKISATLASLGTPSFFLHPAEALHGDLGMVSSNDIVIVISYSGESDEITHILPNIKLIGAKIIAISGNPDSTLVRHSDYSYIFPKFDEACTLKLAPTTSTTATLVLGDALAIAASNKYGFDLNNYALYHPSGSLGKKLLLKVSDLMYKGKENAVVDEDTSLIDAIIEMTSKVLSMVSVVDKEGYLKGILTDGDLRRLLSHKADIYNLNITEVMTKTPIIIGEDVLAVDALKLLKETTKIVMPVVDNDNKAVGVIRLQDILNAGIVI